MLLPPACDVLTIGAVKDPRAACDAGVAARDRGDDSDAGS